MKFGLIIQAIIVCFMLTTSHIGFATGENVESEQVWLEKIKEKIIKQIINGKKLIPIRRVPLPDISEKVRYGVRVYSKDMRLSLIFKNLQFDSGEDVIKLKVGIKNALIEAPYIKAKKKVVYTLSSVCKETRIHIAENETIFLDASISVLYDEEGKANLDIKEINFSIPKDQFRVNGPKSCSGAMGLGKVVRSYAHKLLGKTKGHIEKAVKEQVAKFVLVIEEELNEQ